MPLLTSRLAAVCREHLLREKILVVPSLAIGHQIADTIAHGGTPWVNLRVETMRVSESMQPPIPNKSYVLFRWYGGGSRKGKIVLAEHSSIADPETGANYTIKRYDSEKEVIGDSFKHLKILLKPTNPDPKFRPIEITADNADDVRIIAELVDVLK